MKKTLIAANWKSNKTKNEAKSWLEEVSLLEIPKTQEVVIFPPFTLLDMISGYIRVNDLPFKLGAQNLSPRGDGPYTGEITGGQIKEFADYALIGHSERRELGESADVISRKMQEALRIGLIPILCFSSLVQIKDLMLDPKTILAYEPLNAVGSGNPEDPKKAQEVLAGVNFKGVKLYGGSVNSQNVKSYIDQDEISGVLIGEASLDPSSFLEIIKNVY